MSVQALTQVDPTQFFNLPSANGSAPQRLDTKVSGVAISNDFSGRLSVTTADGDKITLSANLESDFPRSELQVPSRRRRYDDEC